MASDLGSLDGGDASCLLALNNTPSLNGSRVERAGAIAQCMCTACRAWSGYAIVVRGADDWNSRACDKQLASRESRSLAPDAGSKGEKSILTGVDTANTEADGARDGTDERHDEW